MVEKKFSRGFTLVEILIAMAVLAIALTTILHSQSRSLYLAAMNRSATTFALLAGQKSAQVLAGNPLETLTGRGQFEELPEYSWEVLNGGVPSGLPEELARHLRQVDINIRKQGQSQESTHVRLYLFQVAP